MGWQLLNRTTHLLLLSLSFYFLPCRTTFYLCWHHQNSHGLHILTLIGTSTHVSQTLCIPLAPTSTEIINDISITEILKSIAATLSIWNTPPASFSRHAPQKFTLREKLTEACWNCLWSVSLALRNLDLQAQEEVRLHHSSNLSTRLQHNMHTKLRNIHSSHNNIHRFSLEVAAEHILAAGSSLAAVAVASVVLLDCNTPLNKDDKNVSTLENSDDKDKVWVGTYGIVYLDISAHTKRTVAHNFLMWMWDPTMCVASFDFYVYPCYCCYYNHVTFQSHTLYSE